MHWHTSLVGLILTLASAGALAECECLWEGSFSEVQDKTDLIVSGTVLSGKGNAIDLQVDRLLRGAEPQEEIRIWLKTGDYCRPEPEVFPMDSRWVMALFQIREAVEGGFNPGTPSISYGRIGDYRLSNCGGYWLRQTENLVTGNLVNAPRWVRDPKMTPVMLDLVADYVTGKIGTDALLKASQENPALRELMLDTKAFLREDAP